LPAPIFVFLFVANVISPLTIVVDMVVVVIAFTVNVFAFVSTDTTSPLKGADFSAAFALNVKAATHNTATASTKILL
jgi:hypothetical protein